MHSRYLHLLVAISVAALGYPSPARGAFLEGEIMKVDMIHTTSDGDLQTSVTSGDFVVGSGVELIGFGDRQNPTLPELVDIDISDSQILMTLLIDQPFAFQEAFRVIDSNDTIVPIKTAEINPATNWAGFVPVRLFVSNGNVVNINVSQLSGLAGQQILIDLTPLIVPEPASAGLAVCGLAALVGARRQRRDGQHRRRRPAAVGDVV